MEDLKIYIDTINDYIKNSYTRNFREPANFLPYPFLVPGANYSHQLWDWDSWLTGLALMEIDDPNIEKYEKGSVLDFLANTNEQGEMPIVVDSIRGHWLKDLGRNIHKPCLGIQIVEISEKYNNDYSWIIDQFDNVLKYINFYDKNQFDEESGLYFWIDDLAIGFDNDPTVFFQQDKSVAAIYLNSLMYKELESIAKIASKINRLDIYEKFINKSKDLKKAIQEECFDNVDGFFYSASVGLKKVDSNAWLHSGHPRFWKTLPIKITTWAGMLPLWANIASQEQADLAIKRYLNPNGLNSEYGVRSVAKNEKMWGIFDTGNPSCWLGPIWINANYFTYVGLKNYGYDELAKEVAIKTIKLLGNDIIKNGDFHEYYHSETGEGVRGKGFQSWNFLVLKMIKDLDIE